MKQDVLVRVKRSATQRERLLGEFERSGLTGQKFAEMVGIKYQTFATWAQKRRRTRGAYSAVKRPAPLRLLEAVVELDRDTEGKADPAGGLVLKGVTR